MKKISTRIVYQFNKEKNDYEKISDDYYFYEGPIAEAGLGGGSSGGGSQTTTQITEPWGPQQPYILAGLQQAKKLFLDSNPPGYYPGNQVSPFSPQTQTALDLQTMRALQGSPLNTAANTNVLNTIQGNNLYNNPGFNAAVSAAQRQIIPQVQSQFEQSGRTASGLQNAAVAQAIATPFAMQYQNQLDNQMKADLLAPTLAQQDYGDFQQLANVGNAYDQQSQNTLSNLINKYNYNQNIAQQQVQNYLPLISGNYGMSGTSSGTSSQNQSTNPSVLSGLGSALAFGSLLGSGGAGAAAGGGLLGGIGSLLFGLL